MKANKIILYLVVLTILIFVGMASCGNTANKKDATTTNNNEYNGGIWSSMEYRVIEKTIDSCEYIIIYGANSRNIIHKANCENIFHINQAPTK